jgi:alkanesulfonate monooxygenase SsuD/methylene tetrahydromethanopterin reductase-like flavin-dependent oxidoreductase (luciferase family)
VPDYGQPLEFGTFLTPRNSPAADPVERAVLCEQFGYDLVTFQDHPYQPRFLDTWTLLTWVAARTGRIRVSGNVLNLPLRQPAVLARAAASLDLLSGGRFDLALGAGAVWDAMEAMGEPRRTPGEAVQALTEAIEIIRGIWAAHDRSPLRVPGEFHHVSGAKRGPAPSRAIPIVLGAYGPRMLGIVGRLADGWVPSLGNLPPGGLPRGNELIDEAATAAGRDPSTIRRWLNLPDSVTADQLTELVLADGISTFILSSDDEPTLRAFAAEIVPAVRAAVAAARG